MSSESSAADRLCPRQVRVEARCGRLTGPTCGLAPGYVQVNMVVVPESAAADFSKFCGLNPQPCPLLEVTEPGSTGLKKLAADVDLRTDLPKYRVFRNGEAVEEPEEISGLWRDDFVAFLLGCSFSFEEAMLEAGLPVRHIEQGCNVPMYRTNISCRSAGPFRGTMVVSMRPLPPGFVERVTKLCRQFPFAHGVPVQVGDPAAIGIEDLASPDFGDAVTVGGEEIPVFWACGVTPQEVLQNARLEIAISHSPGCMLVSDLRAEDFTT